jgi:fructokinase
MTGSRRVLVVGEALVDIVRRDDGTGDHPVTEHPGGSPANVAVALGRRGVPTELLTCVGTDPRGDLVRRWLTGSGVRPLGEPVPRTATATATIGADGSAEYEFDISWEPSGDPAPGHGIVHTGSIASYLEPGAGFVRDLITARTHHAVITYDPNVRPALVGTREPVLHRIDHLVRCSDVVKVSQEDLAWIAPDTDPLEAATRWLERGPGLVVITFGARGSVARTRGGVQVHREAEAARVVDTVGAGDSFMGAMIAWLIERDITGARGAERLSALDREDVTDLLGAATHAATVTISRPGADPPWPEELS